MKLKIIIIFTIYTYSIFGNLRAQEWIYTDSFDGALSLIEQKDGYIFNSINDLINVQGLPRIKFNTIINKINNKGKFINSVNLNNILNDTASVSISLGRILEADSNNLITVQQGFRYIDSSYMLNFIKFNNYLQHFNISKYSIPLPFQYWSIIFSTFVIPCQIVNDTLYGFICLRQAYTDSLNRPDYRFSGNKYAYILFKYSINTDSLQFKIYDNISTNWLFGLHPFSGSEILLNDEFIYIINKSSTLHFNKKLEFIGIYNNIDSDTITISSNQLNILKHNNSIYRLGGVRYIEHKGLNMNGIDTVYTHYRFMLSNFDLNEKQLKHFKSIKPPNSKDTAMIFIRNNGTGEIIFETHVNLNDNIFNSIDSYYEDTIYASYTNSFGELVIMQLNKDFAITIVR